MYRILLDIYRREGVSGLYSGYMPRVIRKGLNGAITWTIFESITNKSIH